MPLWRKWGFLGLNFVIPIVLGVAAAHLIHRHMYPPNVMQLAPKGASYGVIRVKFKLPGTSAGIPEPLLTVGKPENASIVYIRLISRARARVGVAFWGLPAIESDIFRLPAMDAEIEVTFFLPALFAPIGDAAWGGIPASLQEIRKKRFYILVDNVVRLKGPIDYPQPPHSPVYVGENPVGGSYVTDRFSGTVLATTQSQ